VRVPKERYAHAEVSETASMVSQLRILNLYSKLIPIFVMQI